MRSTILLTLLLCIACSPKKGAEVKKDWNSSQLSSQDLAYELPPKSADESRQNFYGAMGDKDYRLYDVPANTSIADIVYTFQVGSHGAQSYGYDTKETVSLVAGKVTEISKIIPCHVIFADSAGLKLKLERDISKEELTKIESLFPEEIAMQAGLDRYISMWDGVSSLMSPVLEENIIHLWWD